MILVTGPTGSGKTTTLYTALRLLNKEQANVVTLEDPVEYFMSGVNQSQVIPEIDYTFAKGLRQILRQDPDIIMVGEIRDEETASLAIHAALTGHLLLGALGQAGIVRAVEHDVAPLYSLLNCFLILDIAADHLYREAGQAGRGAKVAY